MLIMFRRTRSLLSLFGAMLYIFEDNEAVIKMIIKGTSPTIRHVFRTHRVALDWLFDRINLDPNIHQKPDCRHIDKTTLHTWRKKNFRLSSCNKRMAKRMQEQKEENRVVAKSRPTATNVAISVSTSSSSVNSPIASRSLGILKAPSRQIEFSGRLGVSANQNSNPDSTGRLVAADKDQKYLNLCRNNHRGTCSIWIPRLSWKSCNSRRFRRFGTRKSNLAASFPYITHCADHMEKVFSIVR